MKLKDSIIGFIIGDALGVPAEFIGRATLKNSPITDMEEYGTHYQPKGTWSDDTSMTIATIDSIINKKGIDYNDIMNNFCKWAKNNEYTATDKCFDIGNTCSNAISRFNGNNALECGENSTYSNGNGSLMRILPIVFYSYYKNDMNEYELVKNISSLTHSHEISILGCYLYMKYIHFIIDGFDKYKSYEMLRSLDLSNFNTESIHVYDRILNNQINRYKESEIKSSGYVVDTLEAVLWTILNTNNFKESILTAVNLGDDTDTVAAITGGISGIIYGLNNIPSDWIDDLKKNDYIIKLCEEYEAFLNNEKKGDLNMINLDKEILENTINDLKNNPNACTTLGGMQSTDGVFTIQESNPGQQLNEFIEYLGKNELLDRQYLDNYEKIRDKKIEDYTYDETLTALTNIIRGDRFVSGQIYDCFKNGILLKLVEKLKSFTE